MANYIWTNNPTHIFVILCVLQKYKIAKNEQKRQTMELQHILEKVPRKRPTIKTPYHRLKKQTFIQFSSKNTKQKQYQ